MRTSYVRRSPPLWKEVFHQLINHVTSYTTLAFRRMTCNQVEIDLNLKIGAWLRRRPFAPWLLPAKQGRKNFKIWESLRQIIRKPWPSEVANPLWQFWSKILRQSGHGTSSCTTTKALARWKRKVNWMTCLRRPRQRDLTKELSLQAAAARPAKRGYMTLSAIFSKNLVK